MVIKEVVMVLLDISGYTKFLTMHKTSMLHAELIISKLLESVIVASEHPLTLNKLEGDAAFLYAKTEDDNKAVAKDVTQQVTNFFDSFKATQQDLLNSRSDRCECDACCNINQLELKAFLHHGEVVIKKFRKFEELTGESVILIHRMLKNTITTNEYILMTEEFYQLGGGIPEMVPDSHKESYEEIGEVKLMAYYPKTLPLEKSVSFEQGSGVTRFIESTKLSILGRLVRLFRPKRVFHNLPG